uniref:palmitoyl-acyl carrier protein thioesterase, chloroplastic-like n=1 Tax=Erigeron canadensis TaxID=72917 RepID=UPI001CB8FA15|nr:palmitoyl-acyl carrier protein thioesterase, chloroplastic-like [Erigeron canadensis]
MTASLFLNAFSYHNRKCNDTVPWTKDVHISTKCAYSCCLHHTKVRVGAISITPGIMLDRNIKLGPNMVADLGLGRMVDDFVFRQNFYIRTYEIGPDRKASMETLMNLLQETTVNHIKEIGLLGDGLGLSPEMCKKNLIWVMAKLQVVVDRYPMWDDIVQIDTWKTASGKLGMCSNWMFSNSKTGETLIRASCVWLMMDKKTRKLSKFPNEVRTEFDQYFMKTPPIVKQDNRKWSKRDDKNIVDHYFCNGLAIRLSDLDINEHVNNAKYFGWILESVPKRIVDNYEVASMSLEYCRECKKDSVLQSHTFVMGTDDNGDEITDDDHVDCQHLLQLDIGGGEIMKGRTRWRLKYERRPGPFESTDKYFP